MDATVSVDDSSEDVPAKRPRPYRIKKKAVPSSSTVCDTAVAPVTKLNYGVLIAKTTARMNGIVGKCIAVLDERKRSLLRLCACDSSAAPFWDATQVEAFRVGMTLEYEVGMGPPTAYPHKTEDVYVATLRRSQLDHATAFYSHAQLGAALMPLAKAAVAEVWGDECLSLDGKRPVVHAGARAPSLAVIQGYVTAFDDDSGLATLQASCGTVLPRVKVNCQSAGVGTLQAPALLLIGLARPKPPSTTCLVLLIGKLPMPLPVAAASQLPAQPHSISPRPASAQVRQQKQQHLLLQRRQNRETAAAPTAMVTAAKATAVLLVPEAVAAVPPLATEVDSNGGKAVADQRRPVGGSSFLLRRVVNKPAGAATSRIGSRPRSVATHGHADACAAASRSVPAGATAPSTAFGAARAPADASGSSLDGLEVGTRVLIGGVSAPARVVQRPALNGTLGTIEGFDAARQRFNVRLDSSTREVGEVIALKREVLVRCARTCTRVAEVHFAREPGRVGAEASSQEGRGCVCADAAGLARQGTVEESMKEGASEEDAEDEAENQEEKEEGEGKGGKELAKQMGDGTEAEPQMAVEVAGLEAEEGEEEAEEDTPVLRGTALVGRRVRVWWLGDGDGVCYDGLVKSFSSRRGHQIAYDDGDLRTHNLDDSDEEVWKLC